MISLQNQELLSAFLDGELTAAEHQRAEQLLAEDAECRQFYEELRGLRSGLQSLPHYRVREDLTASVLRRAEQQVLGKRPQPTLSLGGQEDSTPSDLGEPVKGSSPPAERRILPLPRTWRAAVWPVLAIAAALMISVFNHRPRGERDVALAPVEKTNAKTTADAPDGLARKNTGQAGTESLGKTSVPVAKDGNATDERAFLSSSPTAGNTSRNDRLADATSDRDPLSAPRPDKAADNAVAGRLAPAQNSSAVDTPQLDEVTAKRLAGKMDAFEAAKANRNELESASKDKLATKQAGEERLQNKQRDLADVSVEHDEKIVGKAADLGSIAPNRARGAVAAEIAPLADAPAEQAGAQSTWGNGVLIVRCEVTREAVENGAIRQVFADQQIRLTEKAAEESESKAGQKNEPRNAAQDESTLAAHASPVHQRLGDLDLYYVQAEPQQINETINALQAQPDKFLTVSVQPAPESADSQQFFAYRSTAPTTSGLRLREQDPAAEPPAAAVTSPGTPQGALHPEPSSDFAAKPAAGSGGGSHGGSSSNEPAMPNLEVRAHSAVPGATRRQATSGTRENAQKENTQNGPRSEASRVVRDQESAKQVPAPDSGGTETLEGYAKKAQSTRESQVKDGSANRDQPERFSRVPVTQKLETAAPTPGVPGGGPAPSRAAKPAPAARLPEGLVLQQDQDDRKSLKEGPQKRLDAAGAPQGKIPVLYMLRVVEPQHAAEK